MVFGFSGSNDKVNNKKYPPGQKTLRNKFDFPKYFIK